MQIILFKLYNFFQIRREFKLDGNCLEHVFYMATSNTPVLTEHLRVKYVKVNQENVKSV